MPWRPWAQLARQDGLDAACFLFLQMEAGLKYEHILLAILDSNPHLSTASRTALATAATLVVANKSKFTIVFVDEQGKKLNGQRLNRVQG